VEALDDDGRTLAEGGIVTAPATPIPVGSETYSRIAEWLYLEAAMLDAADYSGWFELLAEDITYEMPVRQTVHPKDGTGFQPNFGFFSENHASLKTRILRLQTEQAWAEQPASRTRHYVSNILATQDLTGEYHVRCAFFVTRIRSDLPYDLFTGERRDVLRSAGNGFSLAKRTILIDQTVLKSYNLSIFF
jgi:3-phenylpropionate/cinnamic acid dioxygenase small subunit